jgi:hypothetical protein
MLDELAERGGQEAWGETDTATAQQSAVAADSLGNWKRKFEAGTPADALTWKTTRQRSTRMFAWRVAVILVGSSDDLPDDFSEGAVVVCPCAAQFGRLFAHVIRTIS